MRRGVLFAAEVALTTVTLTVAVGYTRLFTDTGFLPRLLAVGVIAHVLATLWRRRGWSPWVAIALQLVAGVVVISWFHLGDTLWMGLPTGSTWGAARDQLSDAFAPFGELVAPVELTEGFALTMSLTIWVVATFADAAAFGGRAPVQAVIPHAGIVIATSLFARGRGAVAAAAWFCAAVLFHLAAHRAWRDSERRWVGDEGTRGGLRLVATGALTALVVGLLAAWAGPELPGAGSPAAVDLRALGRGAGPLEVGNPLVGVTNLLGPQSDQVVFRAISDRPHYWRLTSLEQFDAADQQWKTRRSYQEVAAGAVLPSERPDGVPTAEVDVRFELTALGGVWLPAVLEPTAVADAEVDVRFDPESASLIAGGGSDLAQTDYELRAEIVTVDAAEVEDLSRRSATVSAVYLDADGVSPAATALAREVAAGSTTRYDQARALQDHLRTFTYDDGVDYSTDADPTAAFLERQRGFCQQFASTFAQMARTLGMPSRVAVGFTSGDPDPAATPPADAPNAITRVVRGRHAHAWPEVLIPGVGWMAFEPTPTRGNPDAASYTGVEAAQAPPDPATDSTPSTTVAEDRAPRPTLGPDGDIETEDLTTDDPGLTTSRGSGVPVVLAVAAAAVLVALAGRTAWVTVHRRRRRGARDDPGGRVRAAWIETCDWLEMVSLRRGASETPLEFVTRVGARAQVEDLDVLARLETERIYGADALEDADAAAAEEVAAGVRGSVAARVSTRQRVLTTLGWTRRN